MSGSLFPLLEEAAAEAGSARILYLPETTLSRRGLASRVRRRARDLRRSGVGDGDAVVVALGPATEFFVTLLACDAVGAVGVPVDPALGPAGVDQVCGILSVRAVFRRPAGADTPPPAYPGHVVSARRRLTGGIAVSEVLEPSTDRPRLPRDAAYGLCVPGPAGRPTVVVRSKETAVRLARETARFLGATPDHRLVPWGPVCVPLFFESAVLPWLGSGAALHVQDAPSSAGLRMLAAGSRVIVLATTDQLDRMDRHAGADMAVAADVVAIDPGPLPAAAARRWGRRFSGDIGHLVVLEEFGPLLWNRAPAEGTAYRRRTDLQMREGCTMEAGGGELLVGGVPGPALLPEADRDAPGTDAGVPGFWHTGFAARWEGDGVMELLGRDDGLVWIEGRRGSLEGIEAAALSCPGVRAARAELSNSAATGRTVVLTLEGDADMDRVRRACLASLPPAFVPDRIEVANLLSPNG